jgi:hypothetical protein
LGWKIWSFRGWEREGTVRNREVESEREGGSAGEGERKRDRLKF